MSLLNIVTSPRRERSASIAVIDSFLLEYQKRIKGVVVDTLDVWTESLPEFDADAIGAKYKGVSGEAMTSSERATCEKSENWPHAFKKADHIVLGVPMWNFSFPYKLKQLIDLACQRNMLFTFDGKEYGPALNIDKAFVAHVRGQSEEAGFQTVPPPGFDYVTKYIEFWLRFIGVRSITAMTVEHTWDSPGHLVPQSLRTAAEIESPTSENKSFRALRLAWFRALQAGLRVDPDAVRLLQQALLRLSDRTVGQNLPGAVATARIQEKRMCNIHKMAAGVAMAVSAATLLMMAEPAAAAPHRAALNYCLSYGEGGTDCSFTSKAQCEVTASGLMAECYRNVYSKQGETLQW